MQRIGTASTWGVAWGNAGQHPRARSSVGSTTPAAAGISAGALERLVHDLADRAGAPTAFRTAAETAIDLSGRARRGRGLYGRAHIVVGQHVTGADNHLGVPGFGPELCCY